MPPPYLDDPSIKTEDNLWRRIPHWWIIRDENSGGKRPASAAFDDDVEKDPDGKRKPMSVFVERVIREADLGEQDVLAGHQGFALVSFTAGLARDRKQGVTFEPADLPGHAVVFGTKPKSTQRAFAKASKWLIPPA